MKVDRKCPYAERDFVGSYWCLATREDIKFCDADACFCLKNKENNKNNKENSDERED